MNSKPEKRLCILAAISHLSVLPKLAGYSLISTYFAFGLKSSVGAHRLGYGWGFAPLDFGFSWMIFVFFLVVVEDFGTTISKYLCSRFITTSDSFVEQQKQAVLAFQKSIRRYLHITICLCTLMLFGVCGGGRPSFDRVQLLYGASIFALGCVVLSTVIQFVVMVFAAIAALQGRSYQYPFTGAFSKKS